jgi:hypothetical protein
MNPFEIRAQLLEMSKQYLDKQFEINTEFARQNFDLMVKNGVAMQDKYQEHMPKMYSIDEVVEQAKKLYGFVNSK